LFYADNVVDCLKVTITIQFVFIQIFLTLQHNYMMVSWYDYLLIQRIYNIFQNQWT